MKKNLIILVIVIIVFVFALAFFMYANTITEPQNINQIEIPERNVVEEESNSENIEGVDYTNFTIYKEDGTEIKLSNYKDMPAVLLFFDSKNEESLEMLKKVEDMYKNYEEKINFFMIAIDKEVNENLMSEYTLEIYYDFYEEAARNYNIKDVPSIIFIDEFNEVFNAKSGKITTDALEANLDILSNNF